MRSKSTKIHAYQIFFPAASAYSALAVPLSVLAMTSTGIPAGLVGSGHAHEMLFGFALALIAGYTLGPIKPLRLCLLLAVWLSARLSYAWAPDSFAGSLLSPLFAGLLAWWVVPRFYAAKKWRNKIVAPLILLLCVLPLIWLCLPLWRQGLDRSDLLLSGIILLALLMAFMGGRVIAPAAAGAFYHKGEELQARVQPRLEAAVIILLPLAAFFLLFERTHLLAAALLLMTACCLFVRLLRWQLWRCLERPDLLGLGIGYAWLAIGIGGLGISLLVQASPTVYLHLITVGALGSLSTGIMARLHTQRTYRRSPDTLLIVTTLLLIALAALARVAAAQVEGHYLALLWLSAAFWSGAYGILFCCFLQQPKTDLIQTHFTGTGGTQ